MLNRQTYSVSEAPPRPIGEGHQQPADVGFREIFAFIGRNIWPIAVGAVVALSAAVAYLVFTPPMYTAQTSLLIDSRKLSIFEDGNVFEDSSLSTATVESQLQILKSGELAAVAVEKLSPQILARLGPNPRTGISALFHDFLTSLIPQSPDSKASLTEFAVTPLSPEELAKFRAATAIRSGLSVSRVGLSYVIDISFSAIEPHMAAQIVEAVAAAYVEDQLNGQFTTAERATKWLEARLNELHRQASDERLSVRERNAVRETYNTFLQRYTETAQQQSLPFTEARVITAANPGQKTSPKTVLIAAGSLILGMLMGLGYGLVRELRDNTIRSCEQAEKVLRISCFGALPKLPRRNSPLRDSKHRAKKGTASDDRSLQFGDILQFASDSIERAFCNAPAVLGIVSANRREGRSTVALCIANSLAASGSRVLLVDADFRDLGLTRNMQRDGTDGLAQALIEGQDPLLHVTSDQEIQCHFLGGGSEGCSERSGEILRMPALASFLESARQAYSYVIIDLPAILSSSDAQIAAYRCSGLLFVVEVGSTTEHDASKALAKAGIDDRVFGVLLNKSS